MEWGSLWVENLAEIAQISCCGFSYGQKEYPIHMFPLHRCRSCHFYQELFCNSYCTMSAYQKSVFWYAGDQLFHPKVLALETFLGTPQIYVMSHLVPLMERRHKPTFLKNSFTIGLCCLSYEFQHPSGIKIVKLISTVCLSVTVGQPVPYFVSARAIHHF